MPSSGSATGCAPAPKHRSQRLTTGFWDPIDRGDTVGLATRLGVPVTTLEPLLPALVSWRARGRERSLVDGWRYRVTWKPVTDLAEAVPRGTWALVGDDVLGADGWGLPRR